jgi:ribonuclease HI
MILGDMNAKSPVWGTCNPVTDPRGDIFERLLLTQDIVALNNGSPTHYHSQTGSFSAIDLSLCSSDVMLDFDFNVDEDLHGSDHYPIILTQTTPSAPVDLPERFNFSKADWPLFKRLSDADMDVPLGVNISAFVTVVEDSIMNAATAAIPLKGNCSKIPVPWFNEDCKVAKRERLRAQRALRRNHTVFNKIAFHRNRARCRYTYKKESKANWQKHLSSINRRTSLSKMWKIVTKISGKFKQSPTPVLRLQNGNIINDKESVANELASAFSSVSRDENYSQEFLLHKRNVESTALNFITRRQLDYNEEFTMKEFTSCLKQTTETSPGIDKITYTMIKNLHPTMINLLLAIYNHIFCQRVFPNQWRIAIVVPIPKPGKDPRNSTNYRPISLTSCLCKLLEKMVNARLMWYLERGGHINIAQSGFRRNRSTTDHIVAIENNIQNSISNKLHTIVIFFDLTKAYDTAWKRGILQNLYNYGMRGNLPLFLQNFLTERVIRVRNGNVMSDSYPLQEGVPQGSVLSCTCFLIAINKITDGIPHNVKSCVYVDDLAVYASGGAPNLIERRLQAAINGITRWAANTGFSFSAQKTVSLHICRKRNCPKLAPNLTLDGNNIRNVDKYKYLGVTFDSSMTWKPHITALKQSCTKSLDLLKHLTHKSWGADRTSLLRLFIMLIKPKIDYGVEAYSSACLSLLSLIDTVENAAIRIATGAFRSSPVLSLYAESGLKPPACYREIKLLNFYTRIIANPTHPLHESVIDIEEAEFEEEDEEVLSINKSYLSRISCIKERHDLKFNCIMPEVFPPYPSWRLPDVDVCEDLFNLKKSSVTSQEMKCRFVEHRNDHVDSFHMYTDGSKSQEGVGYAFISDDLRFSKCIQSSATIFTAELLAIYDSLAHAETTSYDNITIYSDSRSSLVALQKYLNPNPLVQLIQCRIENSNKDFKFCWVPSHVGVAHNELADEAARNIIEEEYPIEVLIPRSDHRSVIKYHVTHKWRERWYNVENNKYRDISDNITPLPHALTDNRLWSVCLTRLRIGHSKLTHGFLMERGPLPYCDDCIVPLSIKHILIECPSHSDVRNRIFGPGERTMKDLLGGDLCMFNGPLYRFVKELELLHKL